MKSILSLATFVFIFGCTSKPTKPKWILESDRFTEQFTRELAEISPELGSGLGYKEYDKLGSNPTLAKELDSVRLFKKWQVRLSKSLEAFKSRDMQVDLEILLEYVTRMQKSLELEEKLSIVPFPEASKFVYLNTFQLINDQSPKQRKLDAVSRFKYYMSDNSKRTVVEELKAKVIRKEEKFKGRKRFYPFKGAVEKYLKDSPSYVAGVKDMLDKSGRVDWKQDYEKFEKQIKSYDQFVKTKILPKARKSPMLPPELYQLGLEGLGVKTKPLDMIKIGKAEYAKLFKRYKELASKIGKSYGLKELRPASVIAHLKKDQVSDSKKVEALYNQMAARLKKIINENEIVSVPGKPLKIRIAGEAESKASPVPHLSIPPLIDNNGIVPEFVVPSAQGGKLPFDDFSYKSSAAILTVHEGRPGHDLQFSRMLEVPISLARARYAFNSVNAEGWGVYAEDLIYPYVTNEEKFVFTQMRLWRIARYFLDPMVQLGQATEKDVIRVFHDELGVSKVMAGLEYNRYAFRSPGQATAYYEGLVNVRGIKKSLTAKLGDMNEKCFHDTLLSFGLLPHDKASLFEDRFRDCAE